MTNEQVLIIGGSDAGISAGLEVKRIQPSWKVTILLADEYPNLSICGIPYAVSGEVNNWHNLAHRSIDDLRSAGLELVPDTIVDQILPEEKQVLAHKLTNEECRFDYTKLVVATGAHATNAGITLNQKNDSQIYNLRTMQDFFNLKEQLIKLHDSQVAVIGAGYIGLEMTEALVELGLDVTVFQRNAHVLPTVSAEISGELEKNLIQHNVKLKTSATIQQVIDHSNDTTVEWLDEQNQLQRQKFAVVLITTGVEPNSQLLTDIGAVIGVHNSIRTNDTMQTSIDDIWAAGDLVETKHRLLGKMYLPLGTTAHKQGRIAGLNIAGKYQTFKGILGTQVLKVFDKVIARTGLQSSEALETGYQPFEFTTFTDDHKAYYPGSHQLIIKIIGDRNTGKLLGAELFGTYGTEVSKRNDVFATAIYNEMLVDDLNDLDLSYAPPFSAPWDPIQLAAQNWIHEVQKLNN